MESFEPAMVERGARLAAVGNCIACHTVPGGEAFAGGLPVPTPFGTVHSTNITPDEETGLGMWSEAAFRRWKHEGVDRAGRHLYPAFPYTHYTLTSDEDVQALYAYLMTREPVEHEARRWHWSRSRWGRLRSRRSWCSHFAVITGLVESSMVKGLMAASLGFFLASFGLDPGQGTPRFTFGQLTLYDGLPLTAMSIGLLAVSEIIMQISNTTRASSAGSPIRLRSDDPEDRGVTLRELLANRVVAIRAWFIGTVIGAIPGLGSATAGFLSYSITKQSAKDPESFGTGDPRGIAASEAANSAVVGANLIPLLTLGIPGNIAAALLVSGFIIHGVQPGPLLFESQGRLIYGLFGPT